MELLGYFSALFIGLSLGLIGGGGSILAVPVLVYLFKLVEQAATAYSLFIVGSTALAGGLQQHFKNLVNWKVAVIFAIPSIIGVSLVRAFVIPALPDTLFSIGSFEFTRRMLMLGMFALLMIPAGVSMINGRKTPKTNHNSSDPYKYLVIILQGLVVGGLSGLVGAGGGFLIIPALVLLTRMDMKTAIGTSLIIIAFQSLLGFLFGEALTTQIRWGFLLPLTGIALIGIFLGTYIGNYIKASGLKTIFGYFIFAMSSLILYMEFFLTS